MYLIDYFVLQVEFGSNYSNDWICQYKLARRQHDTHCPFTTLLFDTHCPFTTLLFDTHCPFTTLLFAQRLIREFSSLQDYRKAVFVVKNGSLGRAIYLNLPQQT